MKPPNALVIYNSLVKELATIYEVGEIKEVADRAKALQTYFKSQKGMHHQQRLMGIARYSAIRRGGQILSSIPRLTDEDRIERSKKVSSTVESTPTELKTAKMAVGGESTANRWQRIAGYPEDLWDDYVQEVKDGLDPSLRDLMRRVRTKEREGKKERPKAKEGTFGKWEVAQSDIQKYKPPRKAHVLLTDPPYGKKYLPLFSELGNFADRYVHDGGLVLVMTGQMWLPEYIERLSEKLTYRWTIAYLTPGPAITIFPIKMRTFWKPVLIFTKGDRKWEDWTEDVITSSEPSRLHHEWGQSVQGFESILEKFAKTTDTVVDPFLGAGSTALAAVSLGLDFLGADIDDNYVKKTESRLKEITTHV